MKLGETSKKIFSVFAITLMFTFTIFFFAPLELYLSNKNYFFFGGEEVVPFALLFFATGFVVASFIFCVIYKISIRMCNILLTVFWAFGFSLYVQGNYVITDYGVMDGTVIDWGQFKKEGIISVVTFCGIIVIAILIGYLIKFDRFNNISKIISICVVLVQVTTLTTLLISENGLKKPMEYISTCDGELELSNDENFIILMLDSFDSQAFGKILKDENSEEYKEILTDFTYYPDTVGCFSWTDLAFPAIISGENYRNDFTYGEYLEKAYTDSPLLNRLNRDNWYSGVYTTSLLPQSDVVKKIDNCQRITRTVSSHKRLAGYMYKLVAFRYLPQPLKKYLWFYPDDMRTSLECAKGDGIDIYGFDNFVFYDKIPTMTGDKKDKVFQFYHIDGTHPPFTTTKDFTINPDKIKDFGQEGIYDEARGMMILINSFLEKMKQEGVYQNSTIIIMADHGYIDLRQSPLLMVKGKNENHPFEQLNTQISYEDLQPAFANILNGKNTAKTIFPIPENENRSRIYTYYEWYVDMGPDSHTRDITEYEVTGNAWDLNNIKKTGNIYHYEEKKISSN